MKFCVTASVFLNVLQVVYTRIKLEDFYPYGPENGDNSVPTNDDGSSGVVNIGFPFPFFDDEHESLFVSTIPQYQFQFPIPTLVIAIEYLFV
jgi:hypothetical protein